MDEFDEFDVTEDEFARMFAEAVPVGVRNLAHRWGWVEITDPGPFTVRRTGACSFDLTLP